MSQRFKDELDEAQTQGVLKGRPAEIMVAISERFRKHMAVEYQAAQFAAPILGQGIAMSPAVSGSIVAMISGDTPLLFQFDHQGAPEQATPDLPFISVGSGQPIADPFLSFLRRLYWVDHEPNLEDGVFAALWTLKHAIQVTRGGVADPIHIVTLSKRTGPGGGKASWQIVELEDDELKEHEEAVIAAEKSLAGFRNDIATEAKAIPQP